MTTSSSPLNRPEPALQTAARRLAEGKMDEAVVMLRALTKVAPTYAAAHVLYATALGAAGDSDAALHAWHQAAVLVPRSPVVLRERRKVMETLAEAEAQAELDDLAAEQRSDIGNVEQAECESTGTFELAEEAAATNTLNDGQVAPVADRDESVFGADSSIAQTAAFEPRQDVSNQHSIEVDPPELGGVRAEAPLDEAHSLNEPADRGSSSTPSEPRGDGMPIADPSGADEVRAPIGDDASLVELLPPENQSPAADAPDLDRYTDKWSLVTEEVETRRFPTESAATILPPEATGSTSGFTVSDELDALISQLEGAPRIRPDPDYDGPMVAVSGGNVDEMASETLAKIYAAQNQYEEAASVYERLAAQRPDRAAHHREQAAEMRNLG